MLQLSHFRFHSPGICACLIMIRDINDDGSVKCRIIYVCFRNRIPLLWCNSYDAYSERQTRILLSKSRSYFQTYRRPHVSLTLALVGGEWTASRPGPFTSGERTRGSHLIRGRVGLRGGLNAVEKWKFLTLPLLELRPLGRPARSQSYIGCAAAAPMSPV
jgi:hypothetical protein